MSSRRDLILTTATHYDVASLTPLVRSWQRHAADADLVVFGNHLPSTTVTWLTTQGVLLFPAELHRFVDRRGWRHALQHWLLGKSSRLFCWWLARLCGAGDVRPRLVRGCLTGLAAVRWRAYELFLNLYESAYQQVLFLDSRDSVFQANPFPVPELQVFAENCSIGDSHFAHRWLQLTYGAAMWRQLQAKGFLCSGVSIAPMTLATKYAALMSAQCQAVLALGGEDQAVHNFIIHCGLVPAKIHSFGAGIAVNLNAVPFDQLHIAAGRLVDADGRPYAVVHQYDRVTGLSDILVECHEQLPQG